jgi:hypothetical protein
MAAISERIYGVMMNWKGSWLSGGTVPARFCKTEETHETTQSGVVVEILTGPLQNKSRAYHCMRLPVLFLTFFVCVCVRACVHA